MNQRTKMIIVAIGLFIAVIGVWLYFWLAPSGEGAVDFNTGSNTSGSSSVSSAPSSSASTTDNDNSSESDDAATDDNESTGSNDGDVTNSEEIFNPAPSGSVAAEYWPDSTVPETDVEGYHTVAVNFAKELATYSSGESDTSLNNRLAQYYSSDALTTNELAISGESAAKADGYNNFSSTITPTKVYALDGVYSTNIDGVYKVDVIVQYDAVYVLSSSYTKNVSDSESYEVYVKKENDSYKVYKIVDKDFDAPW